MISAEYQALLEKEHVPSVGQEPWGQTAKLLVNKIVNYADKINTNTILDYGAGHGGLRKELAKQYPNRFTVSEYEPGRPDASELPSPSRYVVCIDVLEHVEPEYIDTVLDHLQEVVLENGYFTISCRLATKVLADGRNAHLIVEDKSWWRDKLSARFTILDESYDQRDQNYQVFVQPKT